MFWGCFCDCCWIRGSVEAGGVLGSVCFWVLFASGDLVRRRWVTRLWIVTEKKLESGVLRRRREERSGGDWKQRRKAAVLFVSSEFAGAYALRKQWKKVHRKIQCGFDIISKLLAGGYFETVKRKIKWLGVLGCRSFAGFQGGGRWKRKGKERLFFKILLIWKFFDSEKYFTTILI